MLYFSIYGMEGTLLILGKNNIISKDKTNQISITFVKF